MEDVRFAQASLYTFSEICIRGQFRALREVVLYTPFFRSTQAQDKQEDLTTEKQREIFLPKTCQSII